MTFSTFLTHLNISSSTLLPRGYEASTNFDQGFEKGRAFTSHRTSTTYRLSLVAARMTSGIWLAQTARASMAAFQVGSIFTSSIIQPLYTEQTFASITPPVIDILQAVGFSNLGLICALYTARGMHRECLILNAITMAMTGAVYVNFPVKPPHVNIPFVATLFGVAVVNLFNLIGVSSVKREHKFQMKERFSLWYNLSQYLKGAIGTGALLLGSGVIARVATPPIAQVYWLQVALNLLVSAVIGDRVQLSWKADALLMVGIAVCLLRSNVTLVALSGLSATLMVASVFQRPARGKI